MKRGRGRPKGSKNKSIKIIVNPLKRLRKEIRDLKAKKLLLPSGSQERIELHREMLKLKQLLKEQKAEKINTTIIKKELDIEKEPLIKEILELDSLCIYVDLNKYTVEQLQKHIDCIKSKRKVLQGIDK